MTLPVAVLEGEPPQAQALEWLPLAVRFKLDAAGLKVSLAEWQALALGDRLDLLACTSGEAFENLLLTLVSQARRVDRATGSWGEYLRTRSPVH